MEAKEDTGNIYAFILNIHFLTIEPAHPPPLSNSLTWNMDPSAIGCSVNTTALL